MLLKDFKVLFVPKTNSLLPTYYTVFVSSGLTTIFHWPCYRTVHVYGLGARNMLFNATFNIISVYRGDQFYW